MSNETLDERVHYGSEIVAAQFRIRAWDSCTMYDIGFYSGFSSLLSCFPGARGLPLSIEKE
jgi:hypothetical protein